jgi:hypothetical protein
MFLGLPEFGRVSSGFALGEPVQASSCFNSYEKKKSPHSTRLCGGEWEVSDC